MTRPMRNDRVKRHMLGIGPAPTYEMRFVIPFEDLIFLSVKEVTRRYNERLYQYRDVVSSRVHTPRNIVISIMDEAILGCDRTVIVCVDR